MAGPHWNYRPASGIVAWESSSHAPQLPSTTIARRRTRTARRSCATSSPWIGFKHFIDFFTGPKFFPLLRNTVVLGLYSVLFEFPAAILFAVCLYEVHNLFYRKFAHQLPPPLHLHRVRGRQKIVRITLPSILFMDPMIPRSFLNSVLITVLGTAVNLAFTVTMADPLAKRRLPAMERYGYEIPPKTAEASRWW